MTDDELRRTSKVEKQIRDFRIVNPDGSVQGGFGKLALGTQDHSERIRNIEKAISEFRLIGGAGVNVSGGITHGGYTIETKAQVSDSGAGGGGGGPTPTGACCIGASCSVLTATDCATMGGVYQGDDVSCGDVSCGVCPDLALVCDQICATKSVCTTYAGFVDSSPVKYYLTATVTGTISYTCDCAFNGTNACCPGAAPCTWTQTIDETYTIDPATCTHSCEDHGGQFTDFDGTGFPNTVCIWCGDSPCGSDCLIFGSFCSTGITCSESITDDTTGVATYSTDPVFTHISGGGSTTTVFSDLQTVDSLATVTRDSLPAYDGVFDDACSARYSLSEDQHTLDICRFKYKWTFSAAATTNCTLTWNEHTLFDDMTTYDNPMTTSIAIGAIETSVFEVLEPMANGTTTITDVSCTVD